MKRAILRAVPAAQRLKETNMKIRLAAAAPTVALVVTALAWGAAPPAAAADATRCVANVDTQKVVCDTDEMRARRAVGAASSLVIARMYDGINYSGATYTWVQSRACTPSYDSEWQWGNLGEIGWNNRMSSVRTYNHCDVKLYDGYNFGGSSSTWIDASSNLSNVGSGWNNRASSIKFS